MLVVAVAACGAAVVAADPPPQKPTAEAQGGKVQEPAKSEDLVGPATREQIEGSSPEWVQAQVDAKPDAATAKALASVPPGAEVTIFLGTWCGDSRREVPPLLARSRRDRRRRSLPGLLHHRGPA